MDENSSDCKTCSCKFAKLCLFTSSIAHLAGEYASPERLNSIFLNYKSGFVVASLWLIIRLRSWLGAIPLPVPSLATLPLVLLVIVGISLSTPPRTLTGLTYYMYSQAAACFDLFGHSAYPDWLPRVLIVLALLPLGRALSLLLVVAVWANAKSYRDGVASVVAEAGLVTCQATSAAGRAVEHVREAQTLELQVMQAMQMAGQAAKPAVSASGKQLKKEVEDIIADVGVPTRLDAMVDTVRTLAEKAKGVAEEGDLELAEQMVKNTQNLADRVVHVEETAQFKVMELRKKVWGLTLGSCSL